MAELTARVAALKVQLPECLSDIDGNACFSGCNVEIVNGTDTAASANGSGNLIIGFNENPEEYDCGG